jgi:NitT/TauT family transport system permease protein
MAAETFTVGERDYRLPGLGSYLREAAIQSDFRAILWGLLTLVMVIVALDQLVWRPLLAWSDRFKIGMAGSDDQSTSWFYDALQASRLADLWDEKVVRPLAERLDGWMIARFPPGTGGKTGDRGRFRFETVVGVFFLLALLYGLLLAGRMLLAVPLSEWAQVMLGLAATAGRVLLALLIALAWTIPAGVLIGTNRRLAGILQPLVQITASIPATALFPVFLLFVLQLPRGIDIAAVLLMLFGTQWYLLFNIIAGANAIPQDLKYTATLMQLSRWGRWKTLILPALFPYLVTGGITASGGAWNASIVAEYVTFNGQTVYTTGIGSLIAQATAGGNYTLLLAATLTMILAVILINRLVWRRLYRLAESTYRME